MVSSKANSIIGLLRRNLHHCPVQLKGACLHFTCKIPPGIQCYGLRPSPSQGHQGPADDPVTRGQICQAEGRHEEQRHQPPTQPIVGTASAAQTRTPSSSSLQDHQWQVPVEDILTRANSVPEGTTLKLTDTCAQLALTVRAVQTIILPMNDTWMEPATESVVSADTTSTFLARLRAMPY